MRVSLVDDRFGYRITVDGESVGYIQTTESMNIEHIEIDEPHQANGYATQALAAFETQAREQGISRIETTAVISSAFERVLQNRGFEPCEHDETHWEKHL